MIETSLISLPIEDEDFGRHRTDKPLEFKGKQYIYVSILKQLERMMNFPDVHMEISHVKEQNPFCKIFYEDGSNFRDSSFFEKYPTALQLHLYLDEVQMCAEGRSHTVNNKMVFVYFTIGNLPLKFRSNFQSIFLLSIFPNTMMKRFGLNILLKPIIEDIKRLESGVKFIVLWKETELHGILTAVCADNLAAHEIGGFKKGFSKGFRKCRFCLATEQEI